MMCASSSPPLLSHRVWYRLHHLLSSHFKVISRLNIVYDLGVVQLQEYFVLNSQRRTAHMTWAESSPPDDYKRDIHYSLPITDINYTVYSIKKLCMHCMSLCMHRHITIIIVTLIQNRVVEKYSGVFSGFPVTANAFCGASQNDTMGNTTWSECKEICLTVLPSHGC